MDWTSVGAQVILALTPVASFVLVWVLKLAWSKIPASFVLFATPVAGVLANFAISWLTGQTPASPLIAAAFGLVATVLREWITTFTSKGFKGAVSQTDGML